MSDKKAHGPYGYLYLDMAMGCLKNKIYTLFSYKMLELQSSPLIIKYVLHFNLFNHK